VGGREIISPEKTVKAFDINQSGVRERVIMEDREEGGSREIISPEKTEKAFDINQSGAKERVMVSMVGVWGKEEVTKSVKRILKSLSLHISG
jgi:hypothetical protein